jgi:hypothetical protein
VTGVTFATLQSQQAALTGNTIQSATADLRIGTSASTFEPARPGFTFKDVVPGGSAMPADGYSMYLRNYGTTPLQIRMAMGGTLANNSNVDLSKVYLRIDRVDGNENEIVSLQNLGSEGMSLATPVQPGTAGVAQYKLRISMDADAFSGQNATMSGFDLIFSGEVPPLN